MTKDEQKLTDKELKHIAVEIYEGRIFTDRNISKNDTGLVGSIFMPLMLMEDSQLEKMIEKVGMIYEETREAGPRSINGYPMFTSFKTLTMDQMKKVLQFYKEYEKVVEEFTK